MYERFTDRARKTMQLANQEAQRFNHEYIGTEHILLGLVKESGGVAAVALKNLEIDLRKVRLEVEKLVQAGPEMVRESKLPQSPRAKKVIEYSMEEARNLNHNYVGTEHILLGLLREQDGIAATVLLTLNVNLEEVRQEVINLLGDEPRSTKPAPSNAPAPEILPKTTPELDMFTAAMQLAGATKSLVAALDTRIMDAIIRVAKESCPRALEEALDNNGFREKESISITPTDDQEVSAGTNHLGITKSQQDFCVNVITWCLAQGASIPDQRSIFRENRKIRSQCPWQIAIHDAIVLAFRDVFEGLESSVEPVDATS